MKKVFYFSIAFLVIHLMFAFPGQYEEDIYYARCNLKVIKGNYITWINWQSTPTFIPAGTKLKVTKAGDKATLIREDTGSSYTLDIGSDGDVFLEKFVLMASFYQFRRLLVY